MKNQKMAQLNHAQGLLLQAIGALEAKPDGWERAGALVSDEWINKVHDSMMLASDQIIQAYKATIAESEDPT